MSRGQIFQRLLLRWGNGVRLPGQRRWGNGVRLPDTAGCRGNGAADLRWSNGVRLPDTAIASNRIVRDAILLDIWRPNLCGCTMNDTKYYFRVFVTGKINPMALNLQCATILFDFHRSNL